MSDLVRDMLQTYLFGDEPPTDLSGLAGAVDLGEATDVSRNRDDLLADAVIRLGPGLDRALDLVR